VLKLEGASIGFKQGEGGDEASGQAIYITLSRGELGASLKDGIDEARLDAELSIGLDLAEWI
jgi:hypothetical protein